MTDQDLMRMSAEKAVRTVSWKSIEFLFRPSNGLELLLRINFDGMKAKALEWCTTNSPDALPHRLRPPYAAQLLMAIRREEFYRAMQQNKPYGTEEA